jgi:hypothetical protein
MAIDPTLLTLAEELADEASLDLDMTEGSAFRTEFVDPLLNRAGGSPLDVDLETFLVERLETEIDNVDVSTYSAMRDLVIRAFIAMAEPLQREIEGIKLTQSLENYASMTRDELNALLANYFTALQEGFLARGVVRMYFSAPQSITVTPVTQFSTGAGLNFFPATVQQITNTQMSFQQEGDLYYFDVLVQAENAGEDYNIDVNQINSVVGIAGALRVTNPGRFTAGLAEETKAEGVARTQDSITIRNLITHRGVAFVIPENFPAIEILQVIGYGDEEMLRDVVSGSPLGPTDISGIPDGLRGEQDPDLLYGQHIHIGGKTDVYVYQQTPDEEDIDIENLTDKGFRIASGVHGFTDTGGPWAVFQDDFGHFLSKGVVSGDFLLLDDEEHEILGVTQTALTLLTTTAGGQFEKTYEVVRRVDGMVTVPLYDLVAETATGLPIIADSGRPVAPIPGSDTNEQLLDTLGDPVEKIPNVSSENIQLPLLRGTVVDFLDPLTKEPLGQTVPMKDLLLTVSVDGIDGGVGKIRHYFRDAVNAWVIYATTRYWVDADYYRPVQQVVAVGVARADGPYPTSQIILDNSDPSYSDGDYTGVIAVGDRIEIEGTPYTVLGTPSPPSYAGGPQETTLNVREDIDADFAVRDIETHAGILEANMSLDPDTGLYFVDFDVEAIPTAPDQPELTTFRASDVNSEGWTLKTTESVHSYSTRELPYLQVTEWVNDTTRLFITFTAPAIRFSYEYASSLAEIQDFADAEENRIVAEDVLIRHFVPAYVRGSWAVKDLTSGVSAGIIVSYINALSPTEDLEVSDVIGELYGAGSSYVMLPVTMVSLTQNRDRSWTGFFSQDSLGSSRIQHFIADEDEIIVTAL